MTVGFWKSRYIDPLHQNHDFFHVRFVIIQQKDMWALIVQIPGFLIKGIIIVPNFMWIFSETNIRIVINQSGFHGVLYKFWTLLILPLIRRWTANKPCGSDRPISSPSSSGRASSAVRLWCQDQKKPSEEGSSNRRGIYQRIQAPTMEGTEYLMFGCF